MDKKLIITIDGPAGSGKTTIAKLIADKLKIAYLDTGAMYRGVAFALNKMGWSGNEEKIKSFLQDIRFDLVYKEGGSLLKMNGNVLGDEIRTEEVGLMASNIAKLEIVREYLTKTQRSIARDVSLVAEGRDMGSVVFPNADFKFFLDASPEIRAKRRVEQLRGLGISVNYQDILEELQKRDVQDSTRAISPLRPAEDAIRIDTSNLTLSQVLDKIMWYIKDHS